jgi:hypothetical protein
MGSCRSRKAPAAADRRGSPARGSPDGRGLSGPKGAGGDRPPGLSSRSSRTEGLRGPEGAAASAKASSGSRFCGPGASRASAPCRAGPRRAPADSAAARCWSGLVRLPRPSRPPSPPAPRPCGHRADLCRLPCGAPGSSTSRSPREKNGRVAKTRSPLRLPRGGGRRTLQVLPEQSGGPRKVGNGFEWRSRRAPQGAVAEPERGPRRGALGLSATERNRHRTSARASDRSARKGASGPGCSQGRSGRSPERVEASAEALSGFLASGAGLDFPYNRPSRSLA